MAQESSHSNAGPLFRADIGIHPTHVGLRRVPPQVAPNPPASASLPRPVVESRARAAGYGDLMMVIDADDIAVILHSEIDGLPQGTSHSAFDLVELGFQSRMRRLLGKCRKTMSAQRDVFELRGIPDRFVMLVARPDPKPGCPDELCASGCDVSELVVCQRAAKKQSVLLEQVLAVSPDHIFWKDKDFRFLGGNNNFAKVLGVETIDDLIGKTDYDFFPKEEADFYREIDEAVMQSGVPILNLEERQTREDGTEEVLLTNKVPFRNENGEIIGLLGVFEEITERKAMEDKLRHRATHDDLTGLANRRSLIGHISQTLSSLTGENVASLLFIDMDRFKIVNDSLGHSIGDQLVVAIAQRLTELLANGVANELGCCPSDIVGKRHLLSRLGGDEFAILMRAPVENAIQVAEEVLRAMSAVFVVDGIEIYSSASIGIVKITDRSESANEVLRDADIAMYRAKSAGKSRYQLFDQTMYVEAASEMTRQNEIRRAVEVMEFELHYQPVVHLDDQRCTGFEALIRWTPAGQQPVSPATFIPFLEETGLIVRVGEWVIDEACRQLRNWFDNFPDMTSQSMAVNLSRVQFNSPKLIGFVADALKKYDIPPHQLVAEITETAVSENPHQTIGKLKELRQMGVRVAMDDFGVGYSALGKLDQMPIDILKIDQSFINRIGFNDSEPLVKAVLQMTSTLGLATIAEGVEHFHQTQWLQENGCHEAQGYYYARPLPAQSGVHPFEHINLPNYQ